MRENDVYDWAGYWNTNAGIARKKKLAQDKRNKIKAKKVEKKKIKKLYEKKPELKPNRLNPEFPSNKFIEISPEHLFAYAICVGGEMSEDYRKVYKYIRSPKEMYEIKDNQIIRTVSTFHYFADQTNINGLCRSFDDLQFERIYTEPITGKEEIFNTPDSILKEFRKRYKIGRIEEIVYGNTNLDMKVHCTKIRINRTNYYVFSVQDLFGGEWSRPRLFRIKHSHDINFERYIKSYLSQEEIIDKLKSGEIKKVSKFGFPKITYKIPEVLEMLK